jgi:hypothetical protein
MKLRPLLLSLAVLVPVSALVWWLGRPAPAASSADPRVGQRVVEPASLAGAARVKITSAGKTLELARAENQRWILAGDPALPADAARLARLTADLVAPKIERFVSANPAKLATFDLDASGLAYSDASGKALLELDLGKTLENGARILRYGDEPKAYAARLNLQLDADPAAWRDTALVPGLAAADIASLRIDFPTTGKTVALSREKADAPWLSPDSPAGHQVKATLLSSQAANLSTLRYTALAPVADPAVAAAREARPRDLTLTTFSGRSVKIAFARAPEPPAPPAPAVKEGETPPPPPPAAPRPVYVEITDSQPDAILAAAAKTHAFEIADWIFTALPAAPADLFEPVPAPPTPPAASPGLSVTTPPLTVETPAATDEASATPSP